jgi:hypothetical protein
MPVYSENISETDTAQQPKATMFEPHAVKAKGLTEMESPVSFKRQ